MAADETRLQRLGNVVQWEVDGGEGYCRKVFANVTVEDDIEVGACLNSSGDWVNGSNSEGGNTTCILIDSSVYGLANGDHDLVVLYRGPAKIAKDALKFDGTAVAADYTAAAAALEALGIDVIDAVE